VVGVDTEQLAIPNREGVLGLEFFAPVDAGVLEQILRGDRERSTDAFEYLSALSVPLLNLQPRLRQESCSQKCFEKITSRCVTPEAYPKADWLRARG